MEKIIELTKWLNKTADDYGPKGNGKKLLPPKAEVDNLAVAVKRMQKLLYIKEACERKKN